MSDTDRSIVNDYETTIDRLREATRTLRTELDNLVDECDRLRAESQALRYDHQQRIESTKSLLETIDLLRSENARLKHALQTGQE